MKRLLYSITALSVTVLVLSSCGSKAPEETKLIPKDAVAVLSVNAFAAKEKLEKGGITIDTILGKIFEKDSTGQVDQAMIASLRSDAGINWKKDIHLFGYTAKEAATSNNIMALLIGLSNKEKFEAYVSKYGRQTKAVKKEKAFDYALIDPNKIMAWDKEHLLILYYQNQVKPYWDSTTSRFIIPQKTDVSSKMVAQATTLFTQDESASIRSIKGFGEMFKAKADGYLFTSGNSTLSSLSAMPLQIPKLEELLKDNYSASTLSFDDGKINVVSTTYTNPTLANLLKKYAGPTVNLSLVEKYPSQNIQGVMLASFNPALFGGVLKELEVEGLVNGFLEKSGITSKDLYASLKGDIAVVVSDIALKPTDPMKREAETSLVPNKPFGKMLINMPVGDKLAFNKLMKKATELGYLKNTGTEYKAGDLLSMLGLYVIANDQHLIVASDSLLYTQYVSGAGKAELNADVKNAMQNKSVAFFMNIESLLKGFGTDKLSDYDKSLQSARSIFKDVRGYSDNISGNSIKSTVEVRFQNEKQNSLVTLVSLFTNIAVDMRAVAKREKEAEEKMMIPSGVPGVIRTN